ncbi:MAG TPA: PKD domain-containing protein, partial [Bacteroidia bacterium]|nr:PKD domain-containing protein [Bacteroidia bacterium]
MMARIHKQIRVYYFTFIMLLVGFSQIMQAQVFIEKAKVNLPKEKQETPKTVTGKVNGGNSVFATGCNNIDFETGDFTNWTGFEGYNENTTQPLTPAVGPLTPPPTNLNNAETSCQYFAVISNGSTDPNMGIVLTSPLGGNCARMGGENRNLGDANTTCSGNGGGDFTYTTPTQCEADYFGVNIGDQIGLAGSAGEVLQTTFTVTPQNTAFQYAYLFAYTDNGSHDTTQQPYFKVRVLDKDGNEINCLNYFQQGLGDACGNTHAPPGYSGSLATGLFYTSQWQVSSLNLLPYLNQPVTVIFTVAGCTVGGHFGYAYVDCSCAPQQIIIPNTACEGGNTQLIAPPLGNAVFQWSTPNGTIVSGANTTTVTVSQSGTYSVTITPTKTSVDASGNIVTQTLTSCSYELDTTITLYPNPTVSVNSATICTGTTGTLDVTSTGSAAPLTFSWSSTTGLTFTSGDTIATANPPSTTTYTITGTSVHGCKDTAVSHVTVNVEPPPTFTAPAVCLGTPTTFSNNVTAGDTYQWNFGDTHTLADTANIANPSYTYTYSGSFAVNFSVTTAGGCKSNTTQTVTVNPMPVLSFSTTPVCDQSPVCVTNTTPSQGSFTVWAWDYGDGAGTSTAASPGCYTYASPGIYSITLTASTA